LGGADLNGTTNLPRQGLEPPKRKTNWKPKKCKTKFTRKLQLALVNNFNRVLSLGCISPDWVIKIKGLSPSQRWPPIAFSPLLAIAKWDFSQFSSGALLVLYRIRLSALQLFLPEG